MMPESGLPAFIRDPRYLFAGLLMAIVAIYLHLVKMSNETSSLIMDLLFLFAVGLLIWEKRQTVTFYAQWVERLVGIGILALLAWKIQWFAEPLMLRVFPFVAAVAVSAIASGFRGWYQYRQELLILGFSEIPIVVGTLFLSTTLPTAIFSTLLLWYAGYNVARNGVFIVMSGGGVEVQGGCSGIETMAYLLGVSILFLIMFPNHRSRRFFIPLIAILLGFVINSVRVALLAVLSAAQQSEAFVYWHKGQGSMLFGLFGVLLLLGSYWLLTRDRAAASREQPR